LDREVHSQPSGGSKRVSIPRGFGAQLSEAMRTRGHGYQRACGDMGGMDPKTLRKMLKEQGAVHLETLNEAYRYIGETPR
jgi:hypothetical protein